MRDNATVPSKRSSAASSASTESMSRWFVGSSSTSRSAGSISSSSCSRVARRRKGAGSAAAPARRRRGTSSASRRPRPPCTDAPHAPSRAGSGSDRASRDPAPGSRSGSTARPGPRPRRLELADDGLQEHALAGAVLSTNPTRSPCMTVRSRPASTTRRRTRCRAAAARRPSGRRERRPQTQSDFAPLEHRPLDLLHPVDLPLLVARLLDVALVRDSVRPVLKAPDRLLQPLDLLLLRDVVLLLPLELQLARSL